MKKTETLGNTCQQLILRINYVIFYSVEKIRDCRILLFPQCVFSFLGLCHNRWRRFMAWYIGVSFEGEVSWHREAYLVARVYTIDTTAATVWDLLAALYSTTFEWRASPAEMQDALLCEVTVVAVLIIVCSRFIRALAVLGVSDVICKKGDKSHRVRVAYSHKKDIYSSSCRDV